MFNHYDQEDTNQTAAQHPHHPFATQVSVKCPEMYKDSVAADIIECYCPQPTDRVVVMAATTEKAKGLHASVFLGQGSVLVHSDMDRRERVRVGREFEESSKIKCLITNSMGCFQPRFKLVAKLLIFTFPPKSAQYYQETLGMIEGLERIAVCYNTREIGSFCTLQEDLSRKFYMLVPPDVQSQSQEEQKMEQDTATKPPIKKQPTVSLTSHTNQYKIVIKNIAQHYCWKDVKRFLQKHNINITDIRLIQVNRSYSLRHKIQTGFAICGDKQSFEKAIKLNGTDFYGNKLYICQYIPTK